MKRNLILLSSTLLIAQASAFAVENKATNSSTKTTAVSAVAAKTARKGVVPPPPKETLPGNTTMIVPTKSQPVAVETVQSAADTGLLTIGEGGPYTAKQDKVQRFADYIELKKDYASAPLSLVIHNNGFKWFRLLIANQIVATEKSQERDGTVRMDVSGIIQPGSNQVVIQAGGRPGATIDWKVTSLAQAKLERVDPDEAVVGETVMVKGQRFATSPSGNQIMFGNKTGRVISSKATEMKVVIPQDTEPGDVDVTAKVNGTKTNSIKMKVRGIPQVTGTNLQGCPPGQTIIVYGKNFSKNLGENRVFFDSTPAQIMGGNQTQLTVIVPFTQYREGHFPSQVKVQVGKVMSPSSAAVTVGPQMWTDPGVETGRDIPEYVAR